MNRGAFLAVAVIAAVPTAAISIGAIAQDNADAVKKALMGADNKMMMEMDGAAITGDADKDFVAMMIPHHQGAIDMAEVELRYGKDKQLRAMAQAIVKAQEEEIAEMEKWQAAHP